MIMMTNWFFIQSLCIVSVMFLAGVSAHSQNKLEVPPCPSESKRYYGPDAGNPLWTGCKDPGGLFQGILIQFSNQKEVIRIAHVKNSLRHGKEIRFGKNNTLEERSFQNGHLHGSSYIFKGETPVGRLLPKPMTAADWKKFSNPPSENQDGSLLRQWLKSEPVSQLNFISGRIQEVRFGKKKYLFEIKADGRMFAKNHPEIKSTPLIDPEPIFALDADDLKKILMPGFGSCQQYSGPIGKFQRNFDSLLYKRETTEQRHLSKLDKMRERFINFCFPADLKEALGDIECPPTLPSSRPNRFCSLSYSDQLRIPYDPKYFKFKFTHNLSPESFVNYLYEIGFLKFLSNNLQDYEVLKGKDGINIEVKKTTRGVIYRIIDKERKEDVSKRAANWWDWHVVPGH